MNTDTQTNEDRSSGKIAADIRETRSRMDSTLDELGHRLTPRSLLNSAFDWWEAPENGNQGGTTARKAVVGLARQARSHPMPALLIGSGIAWLVSDAMDHDETPDTHRANGNHIAPLVGEGALETATNTVGDALGTLKDKTGDMGDKLHETKDHLSQQAHHAMDQGKSAVRKLKDEVKEGYHLGVNRFGRASEEYPLAIGMGFAALGALAALLIPRTRREDEWMGDRSDQMVQETKKKAEHLMDSGMAVGTRVLQSVKDEAEVQGISSGAIAEKISALADCGSEIVHKAKNEAMQASKDEGLVSAKD